jgi:hypothetical protein
MSLVSSSGLRTHAPRRGGFETRPYMRPARCLASPCRGGGTYRERAQGMGVQKTPCVRCGALRTKRRTRGGFVGVVDNASHMVLVISPT